MDVVKDGVSGESCKPLYVQAFKSATILTDLGSGRRVNNAKILQSKKTLQPSKLKHEMSVGDYDKRLY